MRLMIDLDIAGETRADSIEPKAYAFDNVAEAGARMVSVPLPTTTSAGVRTATSSYEFEG